ncbi:hypothetical protein FACS1894159_02260 [Bacteroidia bacterium]|nr:hypothetical protein FACS1894159_02260 [Bacteroidia bacterium]
MRKGFGAMFFAAIAIVLSGCNISNENDDVQNGDARSVRIQLQGNIQDEGSRAAGPHVGSDPVVVSSGKLFFTNPGGTITKVINIQTGSAAEAGGNVGIGALTAAGGTTITNVPGTSTKVYVLCNITASLPTVTPGSTDISVINDFALQVASLYDATGKGIDNVPVYGAPGAMTSTGTAGQYETSLTLAPVGSRFEIGKFTAGGTITGYKIEGIYINNYYSQQKLSGAIISASSDLMNNGSDPDLYAAPGATGSSYVAALNEAIFDYSASGIGFFPGSSLVCSPVTPVDAAKVWGYNVLAPATGQAPHFVIRLSNVTTSLPSDPYAGQTWFLTIKNMYSSGSNPIAFAPRNVYRIADLAFTENDLAIVPEQKTIGVSVVVTTLNWVSSDIGYDFN